ncbi:MAG: hypothetical protein MI919_12965 [Holophagales bacterium]|nr:hypothetical protein [Holophagales bacterium]
MPERLGQLDPNLVLEAAIYTLPSGGLGVCLKESSESPDDPDAEWKPEGECSGSIRAHRPKTPPHSVLISFRVVGPECDPSFREHAGIAGIRLWPDETLEPTWWELNTGAQLVGTFTLDTYSASGIGLSNLVNRLDLVDQFVFDGTFKFRVAVFDQATQNVVTHDPKIYNRGSHGGVDPGRPPISPW